MKHLTGWRFLLSRHDDPADPPADPPAPGGDPADPPVDGLGDAGKKALDAMKADRNAARAKAAAAEKLAAEQAAKLKEYEDRDKTDAEKLAAKAEAAEKVAAAATARAAAAEVRALAVAEFADPTDAVLLGDLTKYAKADGEVDIEAIKADLEKLLAAKPHLKKTGVTPPANGRPAPDPSQGRGGDNSPPDFRTADKAHFEAELAKYGLRARST
jgi:hypothetical protein